MKEKINKLMKGRRSVPPIALLGAVLIISLVSFFLSGNRTDRRVLFFPDDMSGKVKGETRYLPVYGSLEKNLELLVRELLLGPEYLMYAKAVPGNTTLNTLILDKEKLYLDFSIDLAVMDSGSSLNFEDAINLIKKTVTFNFKNIRTVNITVEGQIPGSAYYSGPSDN